MWASSLDLGLGVIISAFITSGVVTNTGIDGRDVTKALPASTALFAVASAMRGFLKG